MQARTPPAPAALQVSRGPHSPPGAFISLLHLPVPMLAESTARGSGTPVLREVTLSASTGHTGRACTRLRRSTQPRARPGAAAAVPAAAAPQPAAVAEARPRTSHGSADGAGDRPAAAAKPPPGRRQPPAAGAGGGPADAAGGPGAAAAAEPAAVRAEPARRAAQAGASADNGAGAAKRPPKRESRERADDSEAVARRERPCFTARPALHFTGRRRARRRLRSRRADCCGSAGLSTRRGCIHACERAALPACGARGAPDEPGSLPATGRAGDGRLTGPPRRQARCGTARGRCRACCWCTRAARWAWTPRPPSRTTWRATTTCGPAPAGRSRRACAQARARPGASPDPDPSMPFQARLRPGARPAQAPALNLTPACRSRRACAQARARPGASPSPDPSMPFQARLRPGAPPAQAPALPRPSILFRRARALSCARAVAGHAQLWRAPLAP